MDLGLFCRQAAGRPPVMWVCAPAIMASFSSADGGYWYMDGGGAAMEKAWETKDGTERKGGGIIYELYPKHKGRGGEEFSIII